MKFNFILRCSIIKMQNTIFTAKIKTDIYSCIQNLHEELQFWKSVLRIFTHQNEGKTGGSRPVFHEKRVDKPLLRC